MPFQHSRFSLTCNSTGTEITTVIWTKDGFLLSNAGPLVLTDSSTYSYTNVLDVNDRTVGVYTCQVRGMNDQILNSASINIQGVLYSSQVVLLMSLTDSFLVTHTDMADSSPPLNVEASQASPSDPVEVSWSPPSNGATTITGYRIFYGNGGDNVTVPYYVTRILIDSVDVSGQSVSIRSESSQLPSESVQVTIELNERELLI